VGKTNILDAIYLSCYTKSYFAKKDSLLVTHSQQGMFVQAEFDAYASKIIIRENGKKELQLDQQDIKQVQQYLGKGTCVIIAPDDISLINEGGEGRRKYLDSILVLTDSDYLTELGTYNKLMQQRNALLKDWRVEHSKINEYYEQQMAIVGTSIHQKRLKLCTDLTTRFVQLYEEFSGSGERIFVNYDSQLLSNTWEQLFASRKAKDLALQRTSGGIHRDDILFTWDNKERLFKDDASQGQRKTLLFAMKLAMYQHLVMHLSSPPILLLDDVFEKLDEHRVNALLNFIRKAGCQTIITDTNIERVKQAFDNNVSEVQFIGIE
jgi:DNA replication and repair protein RecF